jgi:transcriptional regulator with XRE-family HTH domain
MPKVDITSLRSIREALAKSQREMADLLGISVRAVQSYEQGWRALPSSVQKLAVLLLLLRQREEKPALPSCWEITECDPEKTASCYSRSCGKGQLCWLVTNDKQRCRWMADHEDALQACSRCPVMRTWLEV